MSQNRTDLYDDEFTITCNSPYIESEDDYLAPDWECYDHKVCHLDKFRRNSDLYLAHRKENRWTRKKPKTIKRTGRRMGRGRA